MQRYLILLLWCLILKTVHGVSGGDDMTASGSGSLLDADPQATTTSAFVAITDVPVAISDAPVVTSIASTSSPKTPVATSEALMVTGTIIASTTTSSVPVAAPQATIHSSPVATTSTFGTTSSALTATPVVTTVVPVTTNAPSTTAPPITQGECSTASACFGILGVFCQTKINNIFHL